MGLPVYDSRRKIPPRVYAGWILLFDLDALDRWFGVKGIRDNLTVKADRKMLTA